MKEIINSNLSSNSTPLIDLDLSIRSYNSLKRHGVNTVEQLRVLTEGELRQVPHLNQRCVEEIQEKLKMYSV